MQAIDAISAMLCTNESPRNDLAIPGPWDLSRGKHNLLDELTGLGLSNVGFGSLNRDHEKADTTGEKQSTWLIDIQLKLNKWQGEKLMAAQIFFSVSKN